MCHSGHCHSEASRRFALSDCIRIRFSEVLNNDRICEIDEKSHCIYCTREIRWLNVETRVEISKSAGHIDAEIQVEIKTKSIAIFSMDIVDGKRNSTATYFII